MTAVFLTLLACLAADPLGQVRQFDLPDTAGRRHTTADWADRKAVVLVFLGTECPVSNGYAPVLAALAKQANERGVAFYGIHADPDVTAEQAAKHAREYGLRFPILLDPRQQIARQAGVGTMPEAVVLTKHGTIRYRGRVDDRYTPAGRRRLEATTHDLADAMLAVAAGMVPSVATTQPFGCPLPRIRERTQE